jgi:hypothetical protein
VNPALTSQDKLIVQTEARDREPGRITSRKNPYSGPMHAANYAQHHRNDLPRVLASPELRTWLEEHGAERVSMTQPEFARFVLKEAESAERIIKEAGAKP